jgi:uncharacterized protein (DUF885 family)
MRKLLVYVTALFVLTTNVSEGQISSSDAANKQLKVLIDAYDEERLKLFPLQATLRGDNRYNDLLYIDFTDSFRTVFREICNRYLRSLKAFNRQSLNEQDKINYDVLYRELMINLEGLSLNSHLLVFNQFRGLHNDLALYGSGSGSQPFKTVKDYDNWLRRAAVFPAWSDSAIVYFRKGMAQNMVLPKVLVEKMIPQLAALISTDPTKSTYYGPINKLPADFSLSDKQQFTEAYAKLITEQLNPSYQKLHDFLQKEYLPKSRSTSGYGTLPDGVKLYDYAIRFFTTTTASAADVYKLGLSEVARIQKEMEKVKSQVGYTGDLKSFFEHMRTDPKFYPYKTPEEILSYYRGIEQKIAPALSRMFNHTPKTTFEVRQTEAFRAASAAAQYFPGSLENNRPGIFYVPIVDATKTQARESLFLHEAIPGHHYQVSLTRENESLPNFRRYSFMPAYGEGWALYTESLGKELGMYQDPYQYMMALGDEIHRAIRLVVDAGLHSKGWSREQAIQYSLDNEPIEEQRAISEVERYMAWPGQALAYKIGELKIKELRAKYTKQLGSAFNLAAFHDAILMDGALPLDVLERKMEVWAKQQKRSF